MQTKTITYPEPSTKEGEQSEATLVLSVTVSEATALMGMKRTRLRRMARGSEGNEDIDQQLLHYLLYPDLISSVVATEGFDVFPPDFEAFCQLPDRFVGDWEEATYELNPHWIIKGPTESEETEPDPNLTSSTNA